MNKWTRDEVIYQIYPQSFMDSNNDGVGDILGIISKLDYLCDLGVDAIWICPMYDSPNHDNGYDVRNYFKFQSKYGNFDDFKLLVKSAHNKNIKIIMDLVLNHTSNEHEWFKESASSTDNGKADWYIWRNPDDDGDVPTNWGAIFGGSAWTYDSNRKQYYLNTFSPYQPDLNWENDEMKQALFDMIKKWVELGVDGFRLDAINFISKDLLPLRNGKTTKNGFADIYEFVANKPKVHQYLKRLKNEILEPYKCLAVGEASSATVEDALRFSDEIDMVFQFEHLTFDLGDEPWTSKVVNTEDLNRCFYKWQKGMYKKGWNALLWENHDQPRIVTRLGDTGKYRERSAKMLAVSLYFMQGTPFIYQGQELGMVNTEFVDFDEIRDIEAKNAYKQYVDTKIINSNEMLKRLSRRCRDTSRTPMSWNAEEFAGFSKVTPWIKNNQDFKSINVEEQINREDSVFNFYKKLFALRKKLKVIYDGNYEPKSIDSNKLVAYYRQNYNDKIAVVCNFTNEEVVFKEIDKNGEILLSNVDDSAFLSSSILLPYESIVYRIRQR